ncbi:MAG: DUF2207 domain-containing protein [Armatimonadota bacterium]
MKLSVTLLLLCLLVSRVFAGERIHTFDTAITLHADGSVLVHEKITLSSNAETVRHGITRELPNVVRGEWGQRTKLPLKVTQVIVDGRRMPIYTRQIDNRLSVVMGDALVEMPPGEHHFELEYELRQMVSRSHGRDELNWNATGDRIILPIEHASVTVNLPKSVNAGQVETAAYTGSYGSRDHSTQVLTANDHELMINTTRTLDPQEVFSVVLRWPPGLVTARRSENGLTLGPVGLLLLVAATLGLFLYLCASHIRAQLLLTNHTAAGFLSGMSPAAARLLALGRCDAKALACTIIDLAVKGVIRIELHRRGFTLHRLDENEFIGSGEQRLIFDRLLSGRGSYKVERSYQQDMQRLLGEFMACVKYRWKFAIRQRRGLTSLGLMSGVACSATTVFLFGPFKPVWVAVYILCWSVWASLVGYHAVARMRRSSRFRLNGIATLLYAALMLAPGGLVWYRIPGEFGLVAVCTALLCTSVLSMAFSSLPTPEGLNWFSKLAQFRREYQQSPQTGQHMPQANLGYLLAVEIGRIADVYPNMDWLTLPLGQRGMNPHTLCDRLAMDIAQSAVQPITPGRQRLKALCDCDLR